MPEIASYPPPGAFCRVELPAAGRFVAVADPQGAIFGIIQLSGPPR